MNKPCTKCKILKSKEEFRLRKYGPNSSCRECDALYSRMWRKKNPDKMAESNKRFRKSNPDYSKNRPIEAKEKRSQKESLRRRTDKFRELRSKKRIIARDKENKYQKDRRLRMKQATIFKDQKLFIEAYYENCPKGKVVDHIIPLFGENISGLNVLGNLQYLTRQENSLKGKSFDGTLSNDTWRKIKGPRICIDDLPSTYCITQ